MKAVRIHKIYQLEVRNEMRNQTTANLEDNANLTKLLEHGRKEAI